MTDFYSQNRCVCSTRSHGPLLCAFCLSFHFNVMLVTPAGHEPAICIRVPSVRAMLALSHEEVEDKSILPHPRCTQTSSAIRTTPINPSNISSILTCEVLRCTNQTEAAASNTIRMAFGTWPATEKFRRQCNLQSRRLATNS